MNISISSYCSSFSNEGLIVPCLISLGYIGIYTYNNFYNAKSVDPRDPWIPRDPVYMEESADSLANRGKIEDFEEKIRLWNFNSKDIHSLITEEKYSLEDRQLLEFYIQFIERMETDLFHIRTLLEKNHNPNFTAEKLLNFYDTMVFKQILRSKNALQESLGSDMPHLMDVWKKNFDGNCTDNPLDAFQMALLERIIKEHPNFMREVIPLNKITFSIEYFDNYTALGFFTIFLVGSFVVVYNSIKPQTLHKKS